MRRVNRFKICILRAQNIYKTKYSSIINYVIIWSTCKWLILEEKIIFVTEKDVICKKKKNFFFIQKKTLFVPEKDVTILENYVTITL